MELSAIGEIISKASAGEKFNWEVVAEKCQEIGADTSLHAYGTSVHGIEYAAKLFQRVVLTVETMYVTNSGQADGWYEIADKYEFSSQKNWDPKQYGL